ncbi:flagellar hook-length control protein FliK [Luteibacter jiangsuensis]|uniref:Flagellar hook-length control protein FliK n=1 Tax=Luteibacter jiangsuensis TaxID=637577 RepID=A0ABT9T567_9GAMM|nr:flagellar hook-length control protein FliK [Luteibacter jiangsuensis]MDQ0011317.1 flagellar hook-length control protein FliK [Luteibacter jiangsuensis]
MNNATLALNVSRPAAPAVPPATGRDADGTPPSKRFDAALDAAHADARDPHKQAKASAATDDAAPVAKAATTKDTARATDEPPTKKDDKPADDASIAATMLSLIGVPPKVADLAAKASGALKDGEAGAGEALGSAAALAGALPGTEAAVDEAAALKDGAQAPLGAAGPAGSLGSGMAAAIASPFTSLLAASGDAPAVKDDASPGADAANPMPLAHVQGLGQGGAPVLQVQATQPATSPQFAQELGEQIAWMGSGQVKEARIKLHPEELGSMDVRVNLEGGKVNVAILAQHPAAVHAVQQTLSQLDSMLAHHGLSLGQADVGQRQAEHGGEHGGQATTGQGGDTEASGIAATAATSRVSRGLVDEVA